MDTRGYSLETEAKTGKKNKQTKKHPRIVLKVGALRRSVDAHAHKYSVFVGGAGTSTMRLGINFWTLVPASLICVLVCWVYFKPLLFASRSQELGCNYSLMKHNAELLFPEGLSYSQPSTTNSRSDIAMITPWLAPIVWEGTFDPKVIDGIYKSQNLTIATTVFALGKYVGFLKDFLETAEQHFLLGYRVHYYLFTDRPSEVPKVQLGAGRQLTIIETGSSNRWQEITLRRMERIERLIEERLMTEADYIFSLDVDTKFYGPWGAETLADIIAVLHPGYYGTTRDQFPYERNSKSQAFIGPGEGDYYYGGAVIGGRVDRVHKLAKMCRTQLDVDRANQIEAAWQEESHLNKYFLYNKPSKVLSPEYLWQDFKQRTPNMKVIRFSQVIKNYAQVRPNP